VPRIDLDRVGKICHRVIAITFFVENDAAMDVRLGILWIEIDCFSKIFDRMVVVALVLQDATAIKVGNRMARVDFDCVRVVRDGVITVAVELVDDAAANICIRVPRIDVDRLCIIRNGVVVITLCLEGAGTGIVGDRTVGTRFIRSLKDLSARGYGSVNIMGPTAHVPYILIYNDGSDAGPDCRRLRLDRHRSHHNRSNHVGPSEELQRADQTYAVTENLVALGLPVLLKR
jgi:hypothetical protein